MDDMTPTDKLRALLDERGIEHDDNDANTEVTGVRITRWKNGGKRDVRYEEWRNGTTRLDAGNVSPEQAIAATVTAEPDEATILKLHDRMNAALLDYESAMGIEGGNGAKTVPFVIEMHSLLEDAATAGAETCTMDGQYGNYRCSNCGQSWQLGCVRPKEQSWKYCPHCRARIIKEEAE